MSEKKPSAAANKGSILVILLCVALVAAIVLAVFGFVGKNTEASQNADLKAQLADLVGVSRNTISSIETGQFNPTAKLALILCIALDRKFEDLFYF